jgi:hypothetical protein
MNEMACVMLVMTAVSVISKHNPRATRRLLDQRQHEVEETSITERGAGEVQCEQERRLIAAGVLLQRLHRAPHHPAVDRGHQVVALGGRDELLRHHQLAAVFAQPYQQLAGRRQLRRLAAGGDDRLEVQFQATLVHRPGDATDPVHLAVTAGDFAGVVQVHAVAAGILGGVAGYVGGAEQAGDAVGLRGDLDHADAGADAAGGLLPAEAVVEDSLADILGHAGGLLGGAALHQDAEFIAAQPRDGVAGAYVRLQQPGDVAQQAVAGRVAAGVVDHLELVQVHVQQCVRTLVHRARPAAPATAGCRIRAG